MQTLSSAAWHQQNKGAPFPLADFINSQKAPIVCIKFGAEWCGPCKTIAPLFQQLVDSCNAVPVIGPNLVACFSVDVDESEDIAVAANVTGLPTFVFYATSKLTNGAFEVLETIAGPNAEQLQTSFTKSVQIAQGFWNARHQQQQVAAQQQVPTQQQAAAQQVAHQQAPVQQVAHHQVQQPQQTGQQQQRPPTANDLVKRELAEMRNLLVAAVQRLDRLFGSLQ